VRRTAFSSRKLPGWLLFTGNFGGRDTTLSGDVTSFEFSADHRLYGSSYRLTCDLSVPVLARTERYPGESMWAALQSWKAGGPERRWPPEIAAMLELARNHPEEYKRLREAEAAEAEQLARASLAVVPDVWKPDGTVLRGTDALGG
jgi:hypothetical protein